MFLGQGDLLCIFCSLYSGHIFFHLKYILKTQRPFIIFLYFSSEFDLAISLFLVNHCFQNDSRGVYVFSWKCVLSDKLLSFKNSSASQRKGYQKCQSEQEFIHEELNTGHRPFRLSHVKEWFFKMPPQGQDDVLGALGGKERGAWATPHAKHVTKIWSINSHN